MLQDAYSLTRRLPDMKNINTAQNWAASEIMIEQRTGADREKPNHQCTHVRNWRAASGPGSVGATEERTEVARVVELDSGLVMQLNVSRSVAAVAAVTAVTAAPSGNGGGGDGIDAGGAGATDTLRLKRWLRVLMHAPSSLLLVKTLKCQCLT